jgi:hypothetical protein
MIIKRSIISVFQTTYLPPYNLVALGEVHREVEQENIHSENMNGFENNHLPIEGSKPNKKKTQLSAIIYSRSNEANTNSQSQPSI